ncbi:site-specific DNA-methyltransferase [Pelodictyon phaeoclathratiforme]|jgi:adenine-specific DNA-methyltransferase|uniref:site-specific DNA-methyltransferase (adenine-specific) n=1 Tax=Pelodictyon phaeoclathratiforme (strain DSM 5477 / BU-1) TaxID=324925 RepID=B4SG96_PELPB|nr:site-specific DNA-methyltransferase [Pelodictyon phaeoclathratiforme]ACF43407.1 Site-specific DNA-methyltransferase (adenine-specific) [Pelodictyon phaeoclathratiforme BU-1]MBV5289350.1 site-specific DNA-methyltransferase [Pelodictyon phaeoclathratiforme]
MTEHEEATIKPLTANDPEAQSADILAGNIEQLKTLFPEAFTEGKIDFEVLRQLLGGTVEEREEKYGLNWHGKRKARQLALTPSTGTLRPCPEESVDWETTKNLMIEGDNLEVLKLLQKSYSGKVKLIYIDPPYNTGKDFVYPDNFQDNIKNYLELTGQIEGGRKISSNTEASGRFHTDWLNMMYPRLKLARNLLREDGVIFISIDDGELDNLRKLCAEVFGDENFVVQIIWRKRSTPPNDKIIGANHDYILCFAKNAISVKLQHRERSADQIARYKNPDNHAKGPWAPGDLMANIKGGRFVKSLNFPIVNPQTGEEHFPGNNGNWRFSRETIATLLANNEIYFGENGRGKPKLKRFLCEVKEGVTYPSIWDFVPLNTSGSNEMGAIFGNPTIFESPKPVGLIQELVALGCEPNGVVLDFFAGSGTTGHALMAQNVIDGGNRRYILVQLPEQLYLENNEQRVSGDYCDQIGKPRTIVELTKERLRRAARKIKDENPLFPGDFGFRVFKLDSSNINTWEPDRDNLELTLLNSIEHLKGDRTEADIFYELLLKLGLDLCVPIEKRTFAGKEVHSVGGGVLLVCLATHITPDEVEPLAQGIVAWHKELAPAGETTSVFRDSAFADDVAKTNLAAILQQHGLEIIRSL